MTCNAAVVSSGVRSSATPPSSSIFNPLIGKVPGLGIPPPSEIIPGNATNGYRKEGEERRREEEKKRRREERKEECIFSIEGFLVQWRLSTGIDCMAFLK